MSWVRSSREFLHERFQPPRNRQHDLTGDLRAAYGDAVHAVGYLPDRLPDGVRPDARYAEHRHTGGADFSPLQPLRSWADLRAAGGPTSRVKLLALGGGPIAAAECQIALALGVPVGLVAVGGTEVGRALAEAPWSGHPLRHDLPPEPEALGAFLGF